MCKMGPKEKGWLVKLQPTTQPELRPAFYSGTRIKAIWKIRKFTTLEILGKKCKLG